MRRALIGMVHKPVSGSREARHPTTAAETMNAAKIASTIYVPSRRGYRGMGRFAAGRHRRGADSRSGSSGDIDRSDMANTLKQTDAGAERGTICQGDALAGASVVMVSYWTGEVLWEAIEAVLSPDQEGMTELILVDNGNSPEVAAELARRAQREPRLVLVTGHGNVGFARACNLGASRARGRHLLLLNPDCRLAPGAIPALLSEAAALGDDWMLGCRVRNPDGSDQRGSRRELLTPRTALVEALRLDRLSPRHAPAPPSQPPRDPASRRDRPRSGHLRGVHDATGRDVPFGGGAGRGLLPARRRSRPLPAAARGRSSGVLRAARGSDPSRGEQPGEPPPHRVAQGPRVPALLPPALRRAALVAPARPARRRHPRPPRGQGGARAGPHRMGAPRSSGAGPAHGRRFRAARTATDAPGGGGP